MDLKHLYILSEIIKNNVDDKNLPVEILDKMDITIRFSPTTFYGIDKEFYFITHGKSYEGFEHSDEVNAKINGVRFRVISDEAGGKE